MEEIDLFQKLKEYVLQNWLRGVVFLACFSIYMMVADTLTKGMEHFAESNLNMWNQGWFAGIVIVVFLLWSGVLSYRHAVYDYLPSKEVKSFILLWCAIYAYYRFIDDKFCFWGVGCFAWLDVSFILLVIYIVCDIRGIYLSYRKKKELHTDNQYLLRDDALTNEKDDLFDYYAKARELGALLESVDLREHAFSVGVVGEWGIGKSTFLNLFANEQVKKKQIVVRFSPRSAKAVDQIAEDFFSVFSSALSPYNGDCNTAISRYAFSLNLDSDRKWLNVLLSVFKNWTSEQQKSKVNDALRTIGKRVFVIVEDLDRLTAPEILEVLKLIDANGNFCNTIFLSAYDKKYVNQVLNKEIGYSGVDSFFTDKYFQYEYHMRRQHQRELQNFLLDEMIKWAVDVCEDSTIKKSISQDLWEACGIVLSYLKTMRHLKRFINLFRVSYAKVWSKVNFLDFVIVTLIRYLDNDAYWDLYLHNFLKYPEKTSDLSRYVLMPNYQEYAKRYAGILHYDQLLNRLFSEHSLRPNNEYNCICRTESFENYFYEITPGKLYYNEMNLLMSLSKIEDALAEIERYYKNDEQKQNAKSIEEFLVLRDPLWVASEERLYRYICLTIFAAVHYSNVKILTCACGFWLRSEYESYLEKHVVASENDYKNTVLNAYYKMANYFPEWVGERMLERIDSRNKEEDVDKRFVDTLSDDVALAETAQKKYDERYGSSEWNARTSMRLAHISNKLNNDLTNEAKRQIDFMMSTHVDDYAKGMLQVDDYTSARKYSELSIDDYYEVKSLVGTIEQFDAWIKTIKNKSLQYIIQMLHNEAMQTNSAVMKVEYIGPDKHADFTFIAQKIKSIKKIKESAKLTKV